MIPGLLSGLLWGLDTVMIGVVLAKLGNDFLLAFLAPILSSFIHDAMSAVWLWVITFLRRGIKPLFKVWHSKAAVEVMVAALLGGPIGMTCYVLSIRDLGSGLTALFSAFFPALGAAMGHFFLKTTVEVLSVAFATRLSGSRCRTERTYLRRSKDHGDRSALGHNLCGQLGGGIGNLCSRNAK